MAKKKTSSKKTSRKNKKGGNSPSTLSKLFKFGLLLSIWGFLALLAIIFYYCHDLPDIAKAAEFDRKRSITVYANDNKTVIARYGELLGENVTFEDLPSHLVNAVIVTEDRRFYYHFGVDPIGILRALITNLRKSKIAQGGSTITQQLAKNLFLSSERTFERKVQEAVLAVWLESKFTKEEILAAYLNRVYMGAGAYGVDAASQIYFQKRVQDLTVEESAILASLLKAPSRYNPIANPKDSRARMLLVMSLLEEENMLDDSNKEKSATNAIITPARKPFNINHKFSEGRHFADWVITRLPDYINNPAEDLEIYTTLDLEKQKNAFRAAQKATRELSESRPKDFETSPEFSALFADKNGAVRVLLGGANYNNSQFNRATQAKRQPGSAFKPIVYLAALKQGYDMNDYISDDEFEKNGYSPQNYDGVFHGDVPLWEALMFSYNVATVRLLDEIGIKPVLDLAERLGIESEIQPDLSIGLGTSEVTLLELTQAFHNIKVFAQSKNGQPLYAINKITQPNGTILFDRNKETPENLKPNNNQDSTDRENSTFFLFNTREQKYQELTAMMQGVVMHGTGKRANIGLPVAGKTGTSQSNRDAWFIGYSSEYTGAVWIGYDDNKSMKDVYGGTAPTSIWADIMRDLHKGLGGAPLVDREYSFEYKKNFFDNFGNRDRFNGSPSGNERQNFETIGTRELTGDIRDRQQLDDQGFNRLGNNPDSLR